VNEVKESDLLACLKNSQQSKEFFWYCRCASRYKFDKSMDCKNCRAHCWTYNESCEM